MLWPEAEEQDELLLSATLGGAHAGISVTDQHQHRNTKVESWTTHRTSMPERSHNTCKYYEYLVVAHVLLHRYLEIMGLRKYMAISALIGVMRISTGTPTMPIVSLVIKVEDPLSIHTIALWGSRISRRLESRRCRFQLQRALFSSARCISREKMLGFPGAGR